MKIIIIVIVSFLFSFSHAGYDGEVQKSPGFNCAKAHTKVEHMICDSEELSALDRKLLAIYHSALKEASPEGTNIIKEFGHKWRTGIRDTCDNMDCLRDAYLARLASFTAPAAKSSRTTTDATPPDIAILLKREDVLNDRCRDGSGDDPKTQKYCDERDRVFSELKTKGWCYGEEDQPMYQRKWHSCKKVKVNEALAAQVGPQGKQNKKIQIYESTPPSNQTATPHAPMAGMAPANPTNINKAFVDCILTKAKNDQYSSLDGGKSAIHLIGECSDQWKAYVDACMLSGDTDGNCTVKSVVLAQTALKLLNK